jgi:hypothetical protein
VQQAIDLFHRLTVAQKQERNEILLYWLLGTGTPEFKHDRTDSRYTGRSAVQGQTCGNCRFAYKAVTEDRYICSQIRGDVKPPGWCRFWLGGS